MQILKNASFRNIEEISVNKKFYFLIFSVHINKAKVDT